MDERTIMLKQELESLKKEELYFQFIKEFKCQTEEEFENFKNSNLKSFFKFKYIIQRIREIEWELMNPEERKVYNEYLSNLKNIFLE
jgi:hypothetical protein